MKKILVGLFLLASCSKEENFLYKYEYTTEKSVACKRIPTSLARYDHFLNSNELQAERLAIRSSKRDRVLSDTLLLITLSNGI
jgi:arginyl-tRNA--protein-N-Asp/Glu arginylyltransferase